MAFYPPISVYFYLHLYVLFIFRQHCYTVTFFKGTNSFGLVPHCFHLIFAKEFVHGFWIEPATNTLYVHSTAFNAVENSILHAQ